MKIDRHDQAKILSKDEINRLFSVGLKTARDRTPQPKRDRTSSLPRLDIRDRSLCHGCDR
jgi:hypothetical protein